MVRELTARLHIRRTIHILETATLQIPAVVGWFDPVVLVPAGILGHLTGDQLRAVLTHELAHLRRYDHLVNLVQCLTEALLFFHPAVWWLSRQIREDREYCCDDVAVEVCGDVLSYARTLQDLEEIRAGEPLSQKGFGTQQAILAATGGSLMHRITRLFGVRPTPQRSFGNWVFPGLMVVLLMTALFAASCEPNLVEAPPSDVDTSRSDKAISTTDGQAIVELHEHYAASGLDDALHKLQMAHEQNHITEQQYQSQLKSLHEARLELKAGHSVVVPLNGGGEFILRQARDGEAKQPGEPGLSKVELHELHEMRGDDLHWIAEDGSETLEFSTDGSDTKILFIPEAAMDAVPGAKAQPAAPKKLR
jgi:hypothetical protein